MSWEAKIENRGVVGDRRDGFATCADALAWANKLAEWYLGTSKKLVITLAEEECTHSGHARYLKAALAYVQAAGALSLDEPISGSIFRTYQDVNELRLRLKTCQRCGGAVE